jgi:hypothetical protein
MPSCSKESLAIRLADRPPQTRDHSPGSSRLAAPIPHRASEFLYPHAVFGLSRKLTLVRPVLPIALNRTRSHQIALNRTDFERPLTHSPNTTNEPTPRISRSTATSPTKRPQTHHSTTPSLQHCSIAAAFSAPRRPTQTQSSNNSDQFRAIPTKRHLRKFFHPQNTSKLKTLTPPSPPNSAFCRF